MFTDRASILFNTLLVATLASFATHAQTPSAQSPSEYWASCAAAMTQRALIREELEKKNAESMHGAIGHYYLLSCAYSTPAATDAAYSKAREAQMGSFLEAARSCNASSSCIAGFVEKLDGELLVCAGEQKRRGDDIAKITRVVNDGCKVEIKP